MDTCLGCCAVILGSVNTCAFLYTQPLLSDDLDGRGLPILRYQVYIPATFK